MLTGEISRNSDQEENTIFSFRWCFYASNKFLVFGDLRAYGLELIFPAYIFLLQ